MFQKLELWALKFCLIVGLNQKKIIFIAVLDDLGHFQNLLFIVRPFDTDDHTPLSYIAKN